MKLRVLTVFIAFIAYFPLKSQNYIVPDYNAIEMAITNPNSPYYYPTLMTKYLSADMSLTIQEKMHVYYGFTFQDTYNPYVVLSEQKYLTKLMNESSNTQEEYNIMIGVIDNILEKLPFDFMALSYRAHFAKILGDMELELESNARLQIIADAILTTGDGINKQSPYYIIDQNDKFYILSRLGLEYAGDQTMEETFDYVKLINNAQNINKLYFEISPCLESLSGL